MNKNIKRLQKRGFIKLILIVPPKYLKNIKNIVGLKSKITIKMAQKCQEMKNGKRDSI